MTRRSKLTPETQATIIAALTIGSYAVVAAQAAGIAEHTFYEWLKRGAAALALADKGEAVPDAELPFAAFAEAIDQTSADAELSALAKVRKGEANWQAHMTFLERRYPGRWGRRHIVEGPGGGPIQFRRVPDEELVKLPSDQLRSIAEGRPIVVDGATIRSADEGGLGEGPGDPRGANGAGPPH